MKMLYRGIRYRIQRKIRSGRLFNENYSDLSPKDVRAHFVVRELEYKVGPSYGYNAR